MDYANKRPEFVPSTSLTSKIYKKNKKWKLNNINNIATVPYTIKSVPYFACDFSKPTNESSQQIIVFRYAYQHKSL